MKRTHVIIKIYALSSMIENVAITTHKNSHKIFWVSLNPWYNENWKNSEGNTQIAELINKI